MIRLLNIVAEEGLDGKWNPERGDALHQKAERQFSAGAVRAWAILLRDTINQHLHHYSDEQRSKFLYRHIPEDEFEYFRGFARRIFSNKIWDDPDPTGQITARLAKDDLNTSQALFEEKGLTVQWVLSQE